MGYKSNGQSLQKVHVDIHWHTQRRMACEDGGRERSDVSTSLGMPSVANNHLKLKECYGTATSPVPSEGAEPY